MCLERVSMPVPPCSSCPLGLRQVRLSAVPCGALNSILGPAPAWRCRARRPGHAHRANARAMGALPRSAGAPPRPPRLATPSGARAQLAASPAARPPKLGATRGPALQGGAFHASPAPRLGAACAHRLVSAEGLAIRQHPAQVRTWHVGGDACAACGAQAARTFEARGAQAAHAARLGARFRRVARAAASASIALDPLWATPWAPPRALVAAPLAAPLATPLAAPLGAPPIAPVRAPLERRSSAPRARRSVRWRAEGVKS